MVDLAFRSDTLRFPGRRCHVKGGHPGPFGPECLCPPARLWRCPGGRLLLGNSRRPMEGIAIFVPAFCALFALCMCPGILVCRRRGRSLLLCVEAPRVCQRCGGHDGPGPDAVVACAGRCCSDLRHRKLLENPCGIRTRGEGDVRALRGRAGSFRLAG